MGILRINNDPKYIIAKKARKYFVQYHICDDSYCALQSSIIHALKKQKINLKEKRLECQQELLYLSLSDIQQFFSVRLGVYAYILAIFAIILSNNNLIKSIKLDHPEHWISAFLVFGLGVILSLRATEDRQQDQALYLNFLMQCIDTLDPESCNKNN